MSNDLLDQKTWFFHLLITLNDVHFNHKCYVNHMKHDIPHTDLQINVIFEKYQYLTDMSKVCDDLERVLKACHRDLGKIVKGKHYCTAIMAISAEYNSGIKIRITKKVK